MNLSRLPPSCSRRVRFSSRRYSFASCWCRFTHPANINIVFRRALHGDQEMTFHRPVRAGDVLSTRSSIEDVRDKGTGETISICLRIENQLCILVGETLFMLFVRSDPEKSTSPSPSRKKVPTATADPDVPIATTSQKLEEDQTFRYSEASGDKVKIHLDSAVAKKAGFPGIIGHGLCTLAFTSRAIIDAVGDHVPERLKRLSVRFASPVIPGETLTTRILPASTGVNGHYAFETQDPRN